MKQQAEQMTNHSRKHGIIFTIIIVLYFIGLVIGIIQFNKNIKGNGMVLDAVKFANMLAVTVSYYWVMHLLRVELRKFDQDGIKNELDLVKQQQWLIGVILLFQCLASLSSTIYLAVGLIKNETETECE